MEESTYLVFGDLHGRVLPAFRLAAVWAREYAHPVTALLQVGDLGYFPDLSQLDKATLRHAKDDPSELGVQDVIAPTEIAEAVFAEPECPAGLWFTAGNHEDFDSLHSLSSSSGRHPDFVVDYYCRVCCIKDGAVATVPGGLRAGALWGVDGEGRNRRTNLPKAGYISQRSADELLAEPFDVLLTHDAPVNAKRPGCGSEAVAALIQLAQPPFAFFGHYRGRGERVEGDYGRTQVYHLAGMELSGRDGCAEPGSVGVLTWREGQGVFDYVDDAWLRTFTRHNWKYR